MEKIVNKLKKHYLIVIFVLSIFIMAVMEVGIFNFYELTHRNDKFVTYNLNEIEKEGFTLSDGQLISSKKKSSLHIDCQNQHISKFNIYYVSLIDFKTKMIVTYTNGEKEKISSFNSRKMTIISRNIHKDVKEIDITFNHPLTINAIAKDNSLNINKYRMIFTFFSSFMILYFIVCFREKKLNYHKSFLIIGLIIGMMIVVFSPNKTSISEDDETHFKRTVQVLDLGSSEWTDAKNQMMYAKAFGDDAVLSKDEMSSQNYYLNSIDGENIFQIDRINYIDYSQICYIPSALALKIASLLNMPFTIWFKVGKIANLLVYCLFMYLAIKIIPVKKYLLFVFGLLPSNLWLASNYSYDGFITSLFALSFALFMSKLYDDEKVDVKWTIKYTLASAFAVLPKAVYAPLVLLPLAFKKDKFKDEKQMYKFKGALIILAIVLVSTFVLPAILSPSTYGDSRGAGLISTPKQISYILKNPLVYTGLLLGSTFGQFIDKFFGSLSIIKMGYIGDAPFIFLIILDALMIFFGFMNLDQEDLKLDKYQRCFIIFILFAVNCLIWTAMYLSFTAVGSNVILGVQGRYFLPLLIILLVCCQMNKLKLKVDKNQLIFGLSITMSIILLVIVYLVALTHFCI